MKDTNNAATWMQDDLEIIGNKKIKEICIPGSHDSGMSKKTGGTLLVSECNTLTQSHSILEQLCFGTRYFDIRPVISNGQYFTGHYSHVEGVVTQGANGQSINDVIENLNDFTRVNKELIILNFSHSFNTDKGIKYPKFSEQDWLNLIERLDSVNCKHSPKKGEDTNDITNNTLNWFIENKEAAVVIIIENDTINEKKITNKGFYPKTSFPIYDKYSNTNQLNVMIDDQIDEMKKNSTKYFLLSWTLTQSNQQATWCKAPKPPFISSDFRSSIKDLAEEANKALYRIKSYITPTIKPNIIYTDYISDNSVASLAREINKAEGYETKDKNYKGESLKKNDILKQHQFLVSNNRGYKLIMQDDGNLVLYNILEVALWASDTRDKGGVELRMQNDGNLVIYNNNDKPIWASHTMGSGGKKLQLLDSGELMIYADEKEVWSSEPNGKDKLSSRQSLKQNHFLASKNREYKLIMQDDGNLVLYKLGIALWASHTRGKEGVELRMQDDGNLVIYNNNDQPIWASHTMGSGGKKLQLLDSGKLAIYAGEKEVWSSHYKSNDTLQSGNKLKKNNFLASNNGEYKLVMQDDGNLVLYNLLEQALWASHTRGKEGVELRMQDDGNLVIYNNNDQPIWASHTMGSGGKKLQLLDSGKLAIYAGEKEVWSSHYKSNDTLQSGNKLKKNNFLASNNGEYKLVMQDDGNLVLYNLLEQALWASDTKGKEGVELRMQDDGNLVIYNNNDQPIWASHTMGSEGKKLQLLDSGELVIIKDTGELVWSPLRD